MRFLRYCSHIPLAPAPPALPALHRLLTPTFHPMPLPPSPNPRQRLHQRSVVYEGFRREDEGTHKPFQLDHCHALETTTDTVRNHYPKWYRGTQLHPTQEPA